MKELIEMRHLRTLLLICCLHCFLPHARSQNFDIDFLRSANPEHPNSAFWKATSSSAQYLSAGITLGSLAYALIEHDEDLRYKSYELLLATGVNVLVTDVLKLAFNRPRPAERYPNEVFVLNSSKGYSFPSGHTSVAFSTATTLTLIYPKWWVAVPAYAWAGCVGYSRLYLGRHYPSDVLAGALVGTGSSIFSHWLNKKIFPRKRKTVLQPNLLNAGFHTGTGSLAVH
jgi:membrane-associated phospholipid phosphatase